MDKNKKKKMNNQHVAVSKEETRRAFEQMQPVLHALKDDELVKITTSVSDAAGIVLAAEKNVREHEEEIKALPDFDHGNLDSLREVALAALYADATAEPAKANGLAAIVDEAFALRRSLLIHADSLVEAGVFDAARVARIKSGTGHRDLAKDLIALSALFRDSWSNAAGKTAVTEATVDHAGALGVKLWEMLSEKRSPAASLDPVANEIRVRAYSLLVKRYEEVQRALSYLRHHHGDALDIAPSIFAHSAKRARVRRASEDEIIAPIAAAPAAAPVAPVVPGAPAAPVEAPSNG